MVNSGLPILRSLSILADQTENKELAKVLVAGADRRRAGLLAVGRAGQAPEGLQPPVHLDGQGRRDRRCARRRAPAARRPDREGGRAAAPDQVGDDLPGRRGRPRDADPDRDAAVRRPAVRDDLREPRRHAAAADQDPARHLERVPELLVHRRARVRWSGRSSSGATRRPTPGRARVDAAKLRVPVFGPLFHKIALARFASTLGMLLRVRRADPAGARHRGGDGRTTGSSPTRSTT